jgi:hypothetical protein
MYTPTHDAAGQIGSVVFVGYDKKSMARDIHALAA